ncbi:VWA domain-containing protein [Leekyejoonella antrihumi]|uniref:VWA domain-containing protein n=1 Tax=Leekyejoonella antrihumi TaxID=1660198 RepID=A0A563DWS7_9MICO|nr:VWA domain-containing protein [Leekyejoonella antrihumi]TWP34421.1 VWA domain-containing protein [Leekyejoonella antrihumi]
MSAKKAWCGVAARSNLGMHGIGERGSNFTPAPPPATVSSTDRAKAITLPALTGAPAQEIARRAQKVVLAFLVDRSGSMYSAWGGDPSDVCGAAAETLLSLARRSGGGRAVIVPWGTEAPAQLVCGPHDVRRNRRALHKALREHSSLGGNDMPAALRRTDDVMPELAVDEIPLAFILTDGVEDVTPAMHEAIASLPHGCVHMVLIDRMHWCTPVMEANWRTVSFGSFSRIEHLDVSTMAHQLGIIYAHALGLSLPVVPSHRGKKY